MLELRVYSYTELSDLFHTRDTQGIKRRLDCYGVEYIVTGRRASAQFQITKISDPFKLFCILDLQFSAQTNFRKLLYFIYYLFNDEEFAGLPREQMERRMVEDNHTITRQTIQNYINKLSAADLIDQFSSNYRYYFAKSGKIREASRQEYSKAWKEYWRDKEEGTSSGCAIRNMCFKYGGVARKQPIIEFNGIYIKMIHQINEMVCARIEAELDQIEQST